MNVAVTGATGFIGAELVAELDRRGIAYTVITRDGGRARAKFPSARDVVEWGPAGDLDPAALEGLDAVIHMAGAPVAERWSPEVRRAILESRQGPTSRLVEALGKTSARPGVLVSFSAIGYYGPTGDEELTESAPAGSDFLAQVCTTWEHAAARAAVHGIRVVNPRVGIVIGKGGGALARMLLPFRLGIGGPIGNGRQWMSWVHVSDVVGIAVEALSNPAMTGPVNATAPVPVRNRDFSRVLGRVLHRPAFIPIPVFGLRILFGEFAEILATGQRVIPQAALDAGYRFRHTDLERALQSAV